MVHKPTMRSDRLIALLLAGVLGGTHGLAWAQAIILSPSLAISEEYDDNVFLSPTDRQSDFVTSIRPGLRLAIKEYPLDVTMDVSARGVYYADHPELNSTTDNQNGNLTIEYRPTPRFTASVTDTFSRSFNPGEVDPEIGIITGRFRSTSNTVTPALSYQINPLTRIRLDYAFSIFRSDSPLVVESDTHEAGVFVEREFTPRTSGTFRYTFSHFEPKGNPPRDAHLPRIGLAHALSPTIRVSADAGPLLIERSDGSTEITVGGSLRYAQQFPRGSLSVAYDRGARVAGVIGEVVTTQGLIASATFLATRALTVGLESAVRLTESEDATEDFRVYEAGIRLDYRVLEWLSVNAGYRYTRQDDRTGPLDLDRNLVFLGLTASTDVRIY
jgi:hypothetical protein